MRRLAIAMALAACVAMHSIAHAQQADAGAGVSVSAGGDAVVSPTVAPVVTTPPPPPPPANNGSPAQQTGSATPLERPIAPDATPKAAGSTGTFEFGSYGRVRIASDLRGGTGRQANVVTHGTRIDEDSYAELELRREDTFQGDVKSKVVATLAFFPPFFHFSGNATQQIAVRNLYAQASFDKLTLWAGSRMYRGDDVYLLDWWPLDNQNTVGGGAGVKLGPDRDATVIAAHVGMQRLDNPYQYQTVPAVAPFGVGSVTVTQLDRPRWVETLKVTHFWKERLAPKGGFKLVVYGEAHELAAGVAKDPLLTDRERALPSDTGWLIGTQLGFWTGERDGHVNLFLRHARGVAAYDPLAVPTTFANDRTTSGSTETLIAIGANHETGPIGILAGGYLRFFRDGDPSPTTTQKYDEGTLVVRPQLYIGDHWGIAVEGSYQARRIAVLDPSTNAPLTATAFRAGIIPYFSPSGRGSYKRPQLRILYAVTARNQGTRLLYAAEDVFAQRSTEHFLGLGAEWWFNSSSYP